MDVLDDTSAVAACRTEWDACVVATGGDLYFTTDWVLTWWHHFGKGRRFVAYRLTDAAGPVGVLAFAVETFWLGPFPVRVARLAGMDHNYAILGFPLRSDRADGALELVFDNLLRKHGCAGISLSPVSDGADGLVAVRAAAVSHGQCLMRDEVRRQHTVMHLPETFDAYLAALSKSRRREYRKDLGQLSERSALALRVSAPETVERMMATFIELHTAQWAAAGRGGHFGDWPGSADYYTDLVARLAGPEQAFLEEHRGGDVLLSSQLAFRHGGRCYWRLVARTLDPEPVRLGAGRVGMVERVRLMIEQGVRVIEAGAGEYDYKLSYGGQLVPLRQVVVGTTRKAFRLRLLLAWANLLDLLYYRVWFKKLAPRLRHLTGAKPRPLWRAWIRTRL